MTGRDIARRLAPGMVMVCLLLAGNLAWLHRDDLIEITGMGRSVEAELPDEPIDNDPPEPARPRAARVWSPVPWIFEPAAITAAGDLVPAKRRPRRACRPTTTPRA